MNIEKIIDEAEKASCEQFKNIDSIALVNQARVLKAFQDYQIALRHFSGTSGYGYDDIGRDTLAKVFAQVFGTESALVSPLISGGTHAIVIAMFGLLKKGETLLSITDEPYDTLIPSICGEGNGSLADYGVGYAQVNLRDGCFDCDGIENALKDRSVKVIFIQRSRGYNWRNAFSAEQIGEISRFVKGLRKDITVLVDNCYGEFVNVVEPTMAGADVAVGSLIKNPGGGLAPTGGYIVGSQKNINQIAGRLTAPGIGAEVGSYAAGYQYFYQGFFLAPHTVAQALKISCLAGQVFSKLGYTTQPSAEATPHDIIRSIRFETKEELIAFCQAIQFASPVDSFVTPEPWDMPGYEHQVIMAAGTFVGGASIELSCDSPIKEPYIAYLQGGLTYEHGKLALIESLSRMSKLGLL